MYEERALLADASLGLQPASDGSMRIQLLDGPRQLDRPVASFHGALVHGQLTPGCGLHGLDDAVLVFQYDRLRWALREPRLLALFELWAQLLRVLDEARGSIGLARVHQLPRVLHRRLGHGLRAGARRRVQAQVVVCTVACAPVGNGWRLTVVGYRRLQILGMLLVLRALGRRLCVAHQDVEVLIQLVSDRFLQF